MNTNITSTQIRLWNARYLADKDGSMTDFANKLDKGLSQIGQLIGATPIKNIGNKIAREIEIAFNQEPGWLDTPHILLWNEIQRKEWSLELSKLNLGEIVTYGSKKHKVLEDQIVYIIDDEHRLLNEMYITMGKEEKRQILSLAKLLADHTKSTGKIVSHRESSSKKITKKKKQHIL